MIEIPQYSIEILARGMSEEDLVVLKTVHFQYSVEIFIAAPHLLPEDLGLPNNFQYSIEILGFNFKYHEASFSSIVSIFY